VLRSSSSSQTWFQRRRPAAAAVAKVQRVDLISASHTQSVCRLVGSELVAQRRAVGGVLTRKAVRNLIDIVHQNSDHSPRPLDPGSRWVGSYPAPSTGDVMVSSRRILGTPITASRSLTARGRRKTDLFAAHTSRAKS